MKYIKNTGLGIISIIFILLWSQCDPPVISSVDQPFEASLEDTVNVSITIKHNGFSSYVKDHLKEIPSSVINNYKQYFSPDSRSGNTIWLGIQLPENWSVIDSFNYVAYNSLPATIIDSGTMVYSTELTQLLDSTFNSLDGNKWTVYKTSDTLPMDEGNMWLYPKIVVDENCGNYLLNYTCGYNNFIPEEPYSTYYLLNTGQMNDTSFVINALDDGEGSLRHAISNTRSNGYIKININLTDTIHLENTIEVYKPVNIDNYQSNEYKTHISGPENHNSINLLRPINFTGYSGSTTLRNLDIFNSGNHAIYAENIDKLYIHSCNINNNNGSGLSLINNSDLPDVYINNCNIYSNKGSGINVRRYFLHLENSNISHNNAYSGGGIDASNCFLSLSNNVCIDSNIASFSGGGIHHEGSYANSRLEIFDDVTIKNNVATRGGGLYVSGPIITHSLIPPDIYLNQAEYGRDLYFNSLPHTSIYIDTFSVINPTQAWAYTIDCQNISIEDIIINHGIVQQVNSDIYVSPKGDDKNDGLSWETAKKTLKAASDACFSDTTITIHLDSGNYSQEVNGDYFPVLVTQNLNIVGAGKDKTIIQAEDDAFNCYGNDILNLSNLKIVISKGTAINSPNTSLYLSDIVIDGNNENVTGVECGRDLNVNNCEFFNLNIAIECDESDYIISNSSFFRNSHCIRNGNNGIVTGSVFESNEIGINTTNIAVSNVIFNSNQIGINAGGSIEAVNSNFQENNRAIMFYGNSLLVDNCLFIDNYNLSVYNMGGASIYWIPSSYNLYTNMLMKIKNSEFLNNTSERGAGILFRNESPNDSLVTDFSIENCVFTENKSHPYNDGKGGAALYFVQLNSKYTYPSIELNVKNSIFTNNVDKRGVILTSHQINLNIVNSTMVNDSSRYGIQTLNADTTIITNTIIRDHMESQIVSTNIPTIQYSNIEGGYEGTGNIDEDPLFDEESDYPYSLAFNSPCIDAGNPDTTGLHIPALDLEGNPRIWNNRIDMGAYEWNSLDRTENPVNTGITFFPNPTTDRLTIEFETDIKSDVNIELYNLQGVKTKTWHYSNISQSTYNIDLSELETGVYTIVIVTDGTILAEKIIVM